jgi:hypothetical protein
MRIRSALLLLTLIAIPAGAVPRADELILRKRQVEVRVDENVVRATLSWTVANSGLRSLEGELLFRIPKGAALTEATLAKHIASGDHRSKLLDSARASALYEAVKRRDSRDDDLQEITGLQPIGRIAQRFGQHMATIPRLCTDPALLEQVTEDEYRLRFFPVPANDDQTVAVTLAFESTPDGSDRAVRIPLVFKDAFVASARTEYTVKLDLRSTSPIEFRGSTSHTLAVPKGSPEAREVRLSAREDRPANELAFRYRVAADGRLPAFRPGPGVTRTESLLVIEQSDQKQVERQGSVPGVAPGPDDLKKCGFVRAGAAGCCEHSVATSDPGQVKWAREHGLSPRPRPAAFGFSNGPVYEFDYVAHTLGCPVREVDPAKIKALAAAVK